MKEMIPPFAQSELNLLKAIREIVTESRKQHIEEIEELQKQHNERMAELQKQSEEAQKQFEKSLGKANTQINIAWGAFAVSILSLAATLFTLWKTL